MFIAAFILFFTPFLSFSDDCFYSFKLPPKWEIVNPKSCSKSVKMACIAKSKGSIKPSLNVVTETTKKTFDDYIKIVKDRYLSNRKYTYQSLGYLDLKAGRAHLCQIDTKTGSQLMRTLQCFIYKDQTVYILTGVCKKSDFLDQYNLFLTAFHSFEIEKSPFDSIVDLSKKASLEKVITSVETAWKDLLKQKPQLNHEKLFLDKAFQKKYWKPLESHLAKNFDEKGLIWQIKTSAYIKSSIL